MRDGLGKLGVQAPQWATTWELTFIMFVSWIIFISIPVYHQGIGLSSDALNHHIYLGWQAERPRFDRDFLAVSYQAYQFPYLYWPVYKLAMLGVSGLWAGVVLVSLQMVAVPAVWMLTKICIPGNSWFQILLRILSIFLAFSTSVILMTFDTTSNDFLAAVPFMWAMALGMKPLNPPAKQKPWAAHKYIALSGLLGGISVAFKLSNGPLVIMLPVIWLFSSEEPRRAFKNIASGIISILIGFGLTYGYWGVQLWTNFGNPFYPFYDSLFTSIRVATGWQP